MMGYIITYCKLIITLYATFSFSIIIIRYIVTYYLLLSNAALQMLYKVTLEQASWSWASRRVTRARPRQGLFNLSK